LQDRYSIQAQARRLRQFGGTLAPALFSLFQKSFQKKEPDKTGSIKKINTIFLWR